MTQYRITVIKRHAFEDLVRQYASDAYRDRLVPCPRFFDGQTFEYTGAPPERFCSRAWASIWGDLSVIMCGGNAEWIGESGTMITCCNDGLTPVVFKLERLEGDE